MRLDRNSADGRGKYAVVNLRKAKEKSKSQEWGDIIRAINLLEMAGVLTFGGVGKADEFFVLMLKDKYAGGALAQYAMNAVGDDPEYARDVMLLSNRAGTNSPFCKAPD